MKSVLLLMALTAPFAVNASHGLRERLSVRECEEKFTSVATQMQVIAMQAYLSHTLTEVFKSEPAIVSEDLGRFSIADLRERARVVQDNLHTLASQRPGTIGWAPLKPATWELEVSMVASEPRRAWMAGDHLLFNHMTLQLEEGEFVIVVPLDGHFGPHEAKGLLDLALGRLGWSKVAIKGGRRALTGGRALLYVTLDVADSAHRRLVDTAHLMRTLNEELELIPNPRAGS